MSTTLRMAKKMAKAVEDLEMYTDNGMGPYNFIYRHGLMTSGEREGRLLGFFDGNTERELEYKIKLLDNKFHKYTDTLVDREYDAEQDCWFATYVVLYPFDNTVMSGPTDGQGTKPLF